jgi:hypothetical protein
MQNILVCMKVCYILAESTKPKDMNNPVSFYLGHNVYATLVNLPSGSLSLSYRDKFVDVAPTANGLLDAVQTAVADVQGHLDA